MKELTPMAEQRVCLMYPTTGVLQCPHCAHEFVIETRNTLKDHHTQDKVFYNCPMCCEDILVSQLVKECRSSLADVEDTSFQESL